MRSKMQAAGCRPPYRNRLRRDLQQATMVGVFLSWMVCGSGTCRADTIARDKEQATATSLAAHRAMAEIRLQHIYAVYFGIRACTEIGSTQKDRSFMPDVSLDDARSELRLIDEATSEVGIDATRIWNAGAPQDVVTSEALKSDPISHLDHCHRMGSLFRVDASNLQADLAALGAKRALIAKDY